METLKSISLYIVIALVVTVLSKIIGSNFIEEFLKENLIVLLIALLAINTTTGSVVMTKLREISDKYNTDFSLSTSELHKSVLEQIGYIVFAILILILLGSSMVLSMHPLLDDTLNLLLTTVFVASIYNLYDTANSIFVILKHDDV